MFGFKKLRKTKTQIHPPVLEALESRTLRSTSAGTTMGSDPGGLASTSSFVQGYTPAQILKAHGLDTVGYDSASDVVTATAAGVSASNTGLATAVTNSITLGLRSVSLAAVFAGNNSVRVGWNGNGRATISITNLGNATAAGELNLALYASSNAVLDASSVLLTTITKPNVKISPGMSITLNVPFKLPDGAANGSYDLIGSVTSFTAPSTGHPSNDIAVIGT